VCSIFVVNACKYERNPTINDYLGKNIVFSDTLYIIKNDTLQPQNTKFLHIGNKKVIHLFKADCGKCINNFNQLNQFFNELEGDFDCLFYVNTSNYKFFKTHVYPQLNTNFYLIFNKNHCFEKNNKLEGTYNLFNTFIVNGNHKIEYIGNPVNSKNDRGEFINHLILNNE
jgi:hypothetical protein